MFAYIYEYDICDLIILNCIQILYMLSKVGFSIRGLRMHESRVTKSGSFIKNDVIVVV